VLSPLPVLRRVLMSASPASPGTPAAPVKRSRCVEVTGVPGPRQDELLGGGEGFGQLIGLFKGDEVILPPIR
jgi:hypothetical protein